MPLKKQLFEIPILGGLAQKYAPQRLPTGKAASAVNLVANKAQRLEKRLGFYPLTGADPFGSGYAPTTGLGLGTWNDGAQDNLVIVGRGNRPGTSAVATSLQTYSDDLSGPVLRGQMPELLVASDTPNAGAPGAVSNPMCAVSGNYALSAWIEIAPPLPALPQPPTGILVWQVTQLSTGQIILGPNVVDETTVGQTVQCARLDVIGETFVIAYTRNLDSNIYARVAALSTLLAGGTWSNPPSSGATPIVSNNVSTWAAFTMRSAGDGTNFVVAYESGTGNPGDRGTTPSGIIVQSFTANTLALVNTWTVQSATTFATAFGLRVNTATNHVVVAYSLPDASSVYSYQIVAAVGSYPALTQANTPTVIYTPVSTNASGAPESFPFFIDVSLCPGGALGRENYVATHSPGGSVWNAANLAATAAQVGGTGATAKCGLKGQLASVTITNGGSYNPSAPGTIDVTVTDANGDSGGQWSSANPSGYWSVQLSLSNSYVESVSPPTNVPTVSGTTASLSFSGTTVTATGLSSLTSDYIGAPISIDNSGTLSNDGVFTILTVPSASSCTYSNPNGANDSSGSVHWTTPLPSLVYPLTATVSGGNLAGAGPPATATATINGGLFSTLFTLENGGGGYPPSSSVPMTFESIDGFGSGATATATTNATGQVVGWVVGTSGSGYTQPPTVTIGYPSTTTAPMTQGTPCRLLGFSGTSNLHPENNARILSNMFFVNTIVGGAVQRYNPTDGFGYCCGDGTGPGGSYSTHALSCITPGLTLASCGLEANGIVYYLGWVPSQTEGSFIVLAFDLAQNPITFGGGVITGNGWPMRPVANLQTRTALSDPGGGLQRSTLAGNPTIGPNMWTGASYWALGTDSYATAYLSYVSSSIGERLSLVTGAIQTAPRLSPQMAQWGNLTGLSGAIPTVFDGHSIFEQGFLWSPGSVVAVATQLSPVGAGLDFTSLTDSYSWIFTWEHFDDQGNQHISARSQPVTITGQNLVDAGLVTAGQVAQGVSFSFTFIVPALGATMRQLPTGSGAGEPPLGNDLRAFCAQPTSTPSLGIYRTGVSSGPNAEVYSRTYDRAFNGTDSGGASFTLPSLVSNTFGSTLGNTTPSANAIGTVSATDGLNDSVITRVNAQGVLPFPLLYGDGTNGLPGNADTYCPPASNIMASHKGRLFVARGNQLLYSKVSVSGTALGYNEVLFSVDVGGADAIVFGASMDDRLVIGKATSNYYIAGSGPADDGSGDSYGLAQPIPTDLGCTSPRSIISTPEGVYYQSGAGLRLIDRGLNVRFVGGPPEDELLAYPVVLGAVLHPKANRVILLAGTADTPIGTGQVFGELITRDYVLDAWTTGVVSNAGVQTGFISAAVAWANGLLNTHTLTRPPYSSRLHVLAADGTVWREHDENDQLAYFDNNTFVSWTWTSAPILAPIDDKGTTSLQARFRLWDIILTGVSQDPHGLNISVGTDGGAIGANRAWVWNNGTSQGSIAPGGVIPTPKTVLRTYHGLMGSQFQVSVQEVSDPAATNGAGMQFLGLTCALGVMPGPYKLPASATQ